MTSEIEFPREMSEEDALFWNWRATPHALDGHGRDASRRRPRSRAAALGVHDDRQLSFGLGDESTFERARDDDAEFEK
jgi:hypothetical protein